ncbi:MAG: hypothetical protein NC308_04855 [Clostridium sp.]|nr:hypothetical protein [Bacteroides sp.]MCM1198198.1 hypothetical protein [Clostridium sp.]
MQYSVKGDDYRFKTVLNEESMIPNGDRTSQYYGRFEMYKTENMYNFILLDTSNGNTWQVQWSTDPESRVIIPII